MSPNIKLNGYLSILIFGYVIILHSYLGHFCLLLDIILYIFEHLYEKFSKSACMFIEKHACTSYNLYYMII